MVGLMNTSAQVGGFVSSVAYGYIVERFQQLRRAVRPDGGRVIRRRAALAQDRRLEGAQPRAVRRPGAGDRTLNDRSGEHVARRG